MTIILETDAGPENVDDHQHVLLQHSAVTLAYCARDKIEAANRYVSLLLRLAGA
ncbi:hypothetical protein LGH82_02490 [Mesorhizobium sp. PAMC28654]|uniref:hypothetical protein n=1 Tax=Mesorhizobium sp. PAMC28654 TaxID=2880934 RepID=UPI001D0AFCA4|nr:hypothetical protein [Mesorhizobium sp. PAMC28654]UDL90273.1 hypothetical protein LGH82_02490 [Mesorhizobium sp. PAMC28654]